jgi:DNA topoisomerase-1
MKWEYDINIPKNVNFKRFILGIAEKPTAAKQISKILDSKAKKIAFKVTRIENKTKRISLPSTDGYYLTANKKELLIIPALGHLLTLTQDGMGWQYPVYDFKWIPNHLSIKKLSDLTDFHLRIESTVEVMRYFANQTKQHMIMTDYDEEGEVIGAILLAKLVGNDSLHSAKRMRFSSFAKQEILQSFNDTFGKNGNTGINFGMYNRGLMRHYLDWLWGINLSRALMLALKNNSGQYMTLSTGRVQGPTLSFVSEREHDIAGFVPIPQFKINCQIQLDTAFDLIFTEGLVKQRKKAESIVDKIKDADAIVSSVTHKEKNNKPPAPYNLSSLQRDAYRYHKITPSRTLQAAENLYLSAAISYPRTSSEKYPPGVNHNEILTKIAAQKKYTSVAEEVLTRAKKSPPNEGKKTDPAHPCIHPLGSQPSKSTKDQMNIYNLIIHRYFSTFGTFAVSELSRINFDIKEEQFFVTGRRTKKPGWIKWSGGYNSFNDVELPKFAENDTFNVVDANYTTNYSRPKPRFNQSSLLRKMEDVEIGTKATRSEIIKNLFDRKYVNGDPISITPLGETITEVLKKYSSQVISIELSRKLEQMGDLVENSINKTNKSEESFLLSDAIMQGITYLHQMLEDIQINEKSVGELISRNLSAQRREATIIGTCMKCKVGKLKILHSQTSKKRFVGCSQYFEDNSCDVTFPLPQKGRLEPQSKTCSVDGYPQLKSYSGKRPWILCLNPDCPKREKLKKRRKKKDE